MDKIVYRNGAYRYFRRNKVVTETERLLLTDKEREIDMKYTNVGSYSTAIAIGMTKVKEYPDNKNGMS